MKTISLRGAGYILIAGFVLHNGDHMRRGFDAISDGVAWGGTFVLLLAGVVLTLVFTGHEHAPVAAAVSGPAIAIGVAAAHLPPSWGPLSDSLIDGTVDAATWIAVFAEIGAALFFGWVAFGIVRRNGYALAIPRQSWTLVTS